MADKKKKTEANCKENKRKPDESRGDKTQRSKELALPIIATTPNYSEAARKIGISEEQLYLWLRDPEFKAQVDKARSEVCEKVFQESIETLKNSTTKAVTTLVCLLDRDDYPAVQRAAANDILTHVQKFKELQELEGRIAKLELRAA